MKRARSITLLVAMLTLAVLTLPIIVADEPLEIYIDCGSLGPDLYLTTGNTDTFSVEKTGLNEDIWHVYDSSGNEAFGTCSRGNGCLGTEFKGACHNEPAQPYAETDVNCPGTQGEHFTITTGNDGGSCNVSKDSSGNVTGGACDDGEGNTSSVDCSSNGGAGSCGTTNGAGDCDCNSCD